MDKNSILNVYSAVAKLKSSDLVSKVNGTQFNFKTTNDISTYNGIKEPAI